VTGFAAWAHYRTRRGWAGFDLVRDIARTGDDFALGVQPELMSAAFYEPLVTAMPDQFFSTSMLISPTLRGLLGFRAEAARCRVTLSPQLPADWDRLTVRRLETGCGKLDVEIRREAQRLLIGLRRPESGRAVTVTLEPSLPLGAAIDGVKANGRPVKYQPVATTVTGVTSVEIRFHGGAELVPQETRPLPGDESRGLRLLDWRQEQGRFVATVEGDGQQRFRVHTPLNLRVVDGGRLEGRQGEFTTISVDLGGGGRRRVVLEPDGR
jgi:hypothetical protein